jgi:hypothetical protein
LSHGLSRIHASAGKLTDQAEPFRELRDSFARFANLYQFPLLSTQQQGVEMYAMARRALDVEPLFREVQTQIETTHEYLELRLQAHTDSRMTWLTNLATIAVIMTLTLTADPIKGPILEWLNRVMRYPRFTLDAGAGAIGVAVVLLRPLVASWLEKARGRRGLDT